MLLINKRSAVAVFYALIAVDGEVGGEELDKLDALGTALDPEHFASYRDEVIAGGQAQLAKMIDEEDLYDVLAEGVQDALHDTVTETAAGVPSRLLLWDLLTLAFANDDYDASQRRLIKHVCRVTGCPTSVFLEMEQLMQTYVSVEKERAWLKSSTRPYAEIEPLVTEIESRIRVLTAAAEALIGDELLEPTVEALTYAPGRVESAMDALGEKMEPMLDELGSTTNRIFESAKTGIGAAAASVTAGFGNLFGGRKGKKKNADADAQTDADEDSPAEENDAAAQKEE